MVVFLPGYKVNKEQLEKPGLTTPGPTFIQSVCVLTWNPGLVSEQYCGIPAMPNPSYDQQGFPTGKCVNYRSASTTMKSGGRYHQPETGYQSGDGQQPSFSGLKFHNPNPVPKNTFSTPAEKGPLEIRNLQKVFCLNIFRLNTFFWSEKYKNIRITKWQRTIYRFVSETQKPGLPNSMQSNFGGNIRASRSEQQGKNLA